MFKTKKEILKYLEDFENEDEVFEIKKPSQKRLRTEKQVKYYWWVVVNIISKETWYLPFEVNEQNKSLFWKNTFTDLSTVEFEAVMSLIRQFYFYHLQLSIPKPNEDKFYFD